MRGLKSKLLWSALLAVMLLAGCQPTDQQKTDNPYLGNMSDNSYAGQRTAAGVKSRLNAAGGQTVITDYDGKFVWIDYAAPWCSPCVPQAQAIKSLEESMSEDVVFMTVMTSASEKYEDLPTRQTAGAWAKRFGFAPERVVVSEDHWAWTVPQHYLFSPEGHALYHGTGQMSAGDIRDTIETYRDDWEAWKETGQRADWMQ